MEETKEWMSRDIEGWKKVWRKEQRKGWMKYWQKQWMKTRERDGAENQRTVLNEVGKRITISFKISQPLQLIAGHIPL